MAKLQFPSLNSIINNLISNAKSNLPQWNPLNAPDYLSPIFISIAGAFKPLYNYLRTVFQSLFLTTATNDFLEEYGILYNISRLNATSSSGFVAVQGGAGSVIPIGAQLTSSSSLVYTVLANSTLAVVDAPITLTFLNGVVTATMTVPDLLFATNMIVEISGTTQSFLSGSFSITALDDLNFTYSISESTASNDSGTARITGVIVPIESVDTGSSTRLFTGETLIFSDIQLGIRDNSGFVSIDGIIGGEDDETDTSYRARLLERVQNPIATYSVSYISQLMKTVNGVTRAAVYPTTNVVNGLPVSDVPGYVTALFVRDNDPNIIPTDSQIEQVRSLIIENKPASQPEENVIVLAPQVVPFENDQRGVIFNFTSISPDTTTMRSAIIANLEQFFKDFADIGVTIKQIDYNSAIINTVDPQTNLKLQSFTLASPLGDIAVNELQIALIREIYFS